MVWFAILAGLFAKAYGGGTGDRAYSIVQTPDGGFAAAGWTGSFGAGGTDFLVLKLSPDGSLQWAKALGGPDVDYAYSIAQESDGGFAIAGWTESFGTGSPHVLVVKLSRDGSLEWAKALAGPEADYAYSIAQTSDGGFAVAGWTRSFGSGKTDALIFKLSSDGSLQGASTFGGPEEDRALSVTRTSDGGFAVAGWTESFGVGKKDVLILKFSPDGSLEWTRVFGWAGEEVARSIIQTSDGGFVVAGETTSLGAGSWDFIVLKLSRDGSFEWVKTYGGAYGDRAYSITQTSDGGFAVAGETESFGAYYSDFLVLKLSPDGSLEWARTFGEGGANCAYSIVQTSYGGFAVAGGSDAFGAGDCVVLTIDPNGDYPGCVMSCTPEQDSSSIFMSLPVGLTRCGLKSSTPHLAVSNPALQVTEVCAPPEVKEVLSSRDKITCSPFPGGALFFSATETEIKIYKADGRLDRSLRLRKGKNRVSLNPGVYLWQAGEQVGKVVVR